MTAPPPRGVVFQMLLLVRMPNGRLSVFDAIDARRELKVVLEGFDQLANENADFATYLRVHARMYVLFHLPMETPILQNYLRVHARVYVLFDLPMKTPILFMLNILLISQLDKMMDSEIHCV